MTSTHNRWLLALLFLCLLPLCTPRAAGQNIYAAIHGTVTDASGAVIPHAAVTALNTSTGIATKATTDDKGYYIFPQLQVGGPYTLTVAAPQFQTFSSTGLMLNVNDNRQVNATLSVGTAAQTVNVAASAVQVDTSDTQLKQLVTSAQLEQIPLEGRDPAGLAKLEPGVVESSDRFGSYSTNGSQTPQNSYLLSGIDINDGPLQNEGIRVNPDALAQENIVTSTLNPEFSRNSGQVVNEVIKAGSNSYHGSGFEYYRDTFLNNGNYFSLPGDRPEFHQNLYGGTVGGPIRKDRLFFFLGYQGFRNRTGATTNAQTMSAAQFSGNFTGDTLLSPGAAGGLSDNPIPFAIGGCAAGTPWSTCFPGSTVNIPTTEWNSLASKLVTQFVPKANNSIGGVPYYNFNAGSTRASDQGVIRVDYTPTSRDTIWASSIFESHPGTDVLTFGGGDFPGFGSVQSEHFKLFSGSWTHTFSTNMLNELRGGYYRFNFPAVEPSQVVQPSSYGFNINPNIPQAGLPYMSIGANFNLGFSFEGPQPRLDTNLTYADNFSWVRGSHSLKFGASFEQFRVNNPFAYLNNGYYYYDGGSIYSSGDPLIDFVMGVPDGYQQTSDGFINAVASERYAYAQDNWKVSPSLTVNYGVAWDAEQPNQNRQFGGLGIICYAGGTATSKVFPGGPPGLLYPGDKGCNAAGSPTTHYDHFGPRVGFAWSPSSGPEKLIGASGSHDLSVRGAFGVYFNRDQEEQSLQNLVDPPFLYTSQGAGDFGGVPSFADPFTDVAGNGSETNPFPYAPPKAGGTVNWDIYNYLGVSAFDKSYNTPYVYNFNLNVQRSLPSNMVAQIGYVGSIGRRLATWYEGDPITAAGHAACASGSVSVFGVPCNTTTLSSRIHLYFPQLTANPAVVPGTVGTVLPNGLPWYGSIGMQNSEGSSSYNSLQASLTKAPTHGLQVTLAYTLSHALDNASGYESATGASPGGGSTGRSMIYTPGYTYLNYGDSDYDARQRFVASYIYTVPVGALGHRNAFFREALSGWEIAGVTAMQTGFPVGIATGQDRSLWCDGASYFGCGDNPNTTNFHPKSLNPRASGNAWFDTSSFSLEPLGTFGNTKRNFFHGPGFNYTNLQVSKNFAINADGSRYVQLRLEGFNAFNHANFAGPNGTFTSPAFGTINSVIQSSDPNADPQPGRAVQLAGKVYF